MLSDSGAVQELIDFRLEAGLGMRSDDLLHPGRAAVYFSASSAPPRESRLDDARLFQPSQFGRSNA